MRIIDGAGVYLLKFDRKQEISKCININHACFHHVHIKPENVWFRGGDLDH